MIKIISKRKYENLLDRIDDLTLDLEHLQGENDKLEEQVKIFNADNKKKKEQITKLKIELEDTKEFLKHEKECSSALRVIRQELESELVIQNNQISSIYNMFPETKKFIDDMQLLAEKYDVPEKKAKEKLIRTMPLKTKKTTRKPKKEEE